MFAPFHKPFHYSIHFPSICSLNPFHFISVCYNLAPPPLHVPQPFLFSDCDLKFPVFAFPYKPFRCSASFVSFISFFLDIHSVNLLHRFCLSLVITPFSVSSVQVYLFTLHMILFLAFTLSFSPSLSTCFFWLILNSFLALSFPFTFLYRLRGVVANKSCYGSAGLCLSPRQSVCSSSSSLYSSWSTELVPWETWLRQSVGTQLSRYPCAPR